jgi:hypothetical protein
MRAYPDSTTTLLLGQRRKRGRPLNSTAALIMQPNEAYTQAASSTARRSTSSSTESSLGSPKHNKNEKSSQSLNPPQCPSCGEKMLKKKGFYCKNKCNKKIFFLNFTPDVINLTPDVINLTPF